MFENLEVIQMAQALARHAGARQSAINQNIANADTPGYTARDLPSFADTYSRTGGDPMRATRTGHLDLAQSCRTEAALRANPGVTSPDGNSVSLEDEMVKAVEVKRGHDLALAIYRSSINVLRTSVNGGR